MSIDAWLWFCLIELVLCLNPGPSTLVVMSLAATRGRAAGIEATGGVIAANACYFAAAASGLVAIHSVSDTAFAAVKWCGAAYLVWLGAQTLWRSWKDPPGAARDRAGADRPFWRGLVAQIANPNLLAYFGAILPQFVDPAAPLAAQVAILACTSFVIEFIVVSGYAVALDELGQRVVRRYKKLLERLGGTLLLAAAAGVASLSRS